MSDLLNKASLVMVPSGYKEDTVYSVVPTDGSGDLAFTRASNGTRINSAGLVEVCPWNFIEYSEQFTSAAWATSNGATVSADQTTAPNGTTTADKIVFPANSAANIYNFPTSPVGSNNISVYAKTLSGTKQFRLRIDTGSGPAVSSNFTATTEWQRFDFAVTTTAANLVAYIFNDSTGVAGDLYVWGAQLNIGSTAKPYFPTTDRLNVPRLTYQNGGGGCPSLLLEKQSTNKVTYSEQFDNADWTKSNATINANSVTSPDGTQNADTITDNTTNGVHSVYQIPSGQSVGTAWTCYMKKGSLNYGYISAVQSTTFFTTAIINLTNGSIVELQNGSSTTGAVTTEDCGNGWYRVKIQTNANGAGYAVGTSNGSALSGTYKEAIYTGTGSGTIYIWGAQLEDSSYATSYIPTTSSSATRVVDACFKTGISSLFGTNQGTFFIDLIYNNSIQFDYLFDVSDSSNTNRFLMYDTNGSGLYNFYDTGYSEITTYQFTKGQRYKIAVKYNSSGTIWYVNGVLSATGTVSFANQMSQIYLGTRFSLTNNVNMQVNESIVFPTALTNAELASLTTL